MIDNLTVDKASLNLSYFLKSIKIISDHNNKISRQDFVEEMASFMGTDAMKNGKENRTPYNKLKQVQYFGFSDIVKNDSDTWLCLTRRGEILSNLISEDSQEKNPEKRYYLKKENLALVRKLFIYDILCNSYGRNNCGADRSNSDTEPPKVIVKLLANLGDASCDEICYAIYALNGGKKGNLNEVESWNDILTTISTKRKNKQGYSRIFENWGIKNIVQDFKIIDLLANSNIDVIRKSNGLYSLSPEVEEQYVDVFKQIPCYYRPLMQIWNNDTNEPEDVIAWILDAVINKNEDDPNLLICDTRNNENAILSHIPDFVQKAVESPKNNLYMLIISDSKEQLLSSFGAYSTLLERKDDITDVNNGESVNTIEGKSIKKFPANLHIVSMIVNK